jgi:hypothetical protein
MHHLLHPPLPLHLPLHPPLLLQHKSKIMFKQLIPNIYHGSQTGANSINSTLQTNNKLLNITDTLYFMLCICFSHKSSKAQKQAICMSPPSQIFNYLTDFVPNI